MVVTTHHNPWQATSIAMALCRSLMQQYVLGTSVSSMDRQPPVPNTTEGVGDPGGVPKAGAAAAVGQRFLLSNLWPTDRDTNL